MYNFTGKTFVIMGATSGIGSNLTKLLSNYGATLVLTGRNIEKLKALSTSLSTSSSLICLDAMSESIETELSIALDKAKTDLSITTINGGVYCAGIAPILPLRGIDEKTIAKVFKVNYSSALIFAKILASKQHRTKLSTSIALISSVCARAGEKGLGIYGGSKAALIASTRAFARELAPFNVRINCVSPGWIQTDMTNESRDIAAGLEENMKASHPLGLGQPSDVSSAIAFLLSDESRWITGTNLVVDGGFLA